MRSEWVASTLGTPHQGGQSGEQARVEREGGEGGRRRGPHGRILS